MLTSVSVPKLLDRSFRPSTAVPMIALNLASSSSRMWFRNGRNAKRCQCFFWMSASMLFLMVCLPLCFGTEITFSAGHLFHYVVDLTILCICILSAVDKDVFTRVTSL